MREVPYLLTRGSGLGRSSSRKPKCCGQPETSSLAPGACLTLTYGWSESTEKLEAGDRAMVQAPQKTFERLAASGQSAPAKTG